MPVPSDISELSIDPAGNSPAGSEDTFPGLDNYIRAHAAFLAQLRDGAGSNGSDGANAATVLLFQRTADTTPPASPTGGISYTFSTGALSGGTMNGWQSAVPTSGGDYLWIIQSYAYSTGSTATLSSWGTPAILAQNGAQGPAGADGSTGNTGSAGVNSRTVFLFQRTATASPPAVPSTTTTVTFASGDVTGFNNGWALSMPTSGGAYRWVTTASASASTATDTIAAGEWASPALVAEDGADGSNGADGANGVNSAVVMLFQRTSSATPPSKPNDTITFSFTTGAATNLTNGWTQTLPTSGGAYRWTTTATALAAGTSDSILPAEWSDVALLAQDGANGQDGQAAAAGTNSLTVLLFQRTAGTSPPALPASNVTVNFSTGAVTGITNGWTLSMPTTGGAYRWITTATALSTSTTDTIAPGEWAAASIIAQDGLDGSNGDPGANGADGISQATVFLFQRTNSSTPPVLPSVNTTYTFATGVASGMNNGWVQSLPTSGGAYSWMTTATALGTGSTDTIAPAEWAAAALLSIDDTSTPGPTVMGNHAASSARVVSSGSVTCIAGVEFRRDGTIYRRSNASGADVFTKSGDWYLPNGSTVGDAYSVTYTKIVSQGGTLTGTINSAETINATRALVLSNTSGGAFQFENAYAYTVSRVSDGSSVGSGVISLEVAREV